MEYGDFLQCVQEYAKKETGRGGVVSINHVIKNNGCELDGLVIMEEGKHISPTIYLNGFYKQYQNGRTVEDIVREILHIYKQLMPERSFYATGLYAHRTYMDRT